VRLRAQHQIRGVVNEQGEASVLLHHAGKGALFGLSVEGSDSAGGHENNQNGGGHLHLWALLDVAFSASGPAAGTKTTSSMVDQSA
jgi:hypothetical protein